jgi:putative FmdB family regulatory protein
MPIYEFFCERCNTVYKFFSRRINTEKIPLCPNCMDVKLKRQISLFATVSQKKEDSNMPEIDESKMEKAMAMLEKESGRINEDDPRQAAQLMRRLSEATGIKMGAGMEEALHRLEHGEDPEKIEEEMGDIFESEEPFVMEEKGKRTGKKQPPKIDDTLYELD